VCQRWTVVSCLLVSSGHGAWQTPFFEQELPGVGPAMTMLLQLPWDGPLRCAAITEGSVRTTWSDQESYARHKSAGH